MTWATWLISMVGPIIVKVLAFIGITLTTIAGVDVVFGQLQGYATSNWAGMPAAVIQLCSLAGVPEGLGIIFGAFNARLAMWSFVAAKRFLFSS